jgi:predicted anti-sigma-YlaC factor YlaD
MDGEPEPEPAADTDRHLAGCAACRSWQARAIEVTRLVRVREVTPTPDLSELILDRAPVLVVSRGWWARAALGVVALAQLTIGLSQILGVNNPATHSGHTGTLEAGHLFNESTAWNLAVGIGLFWVVFRASAAAGLIPALGGFVLVLVGFSTHDLITGAAPASRIAEHGLLIAGLVLLMIVRRQHRDPAPGRDDAVPEPDRAGSPDLPDGTSRWSGGPRRRAAG